MAGSRARCALRRRDWRYHQDSYQSQGHLQILRRTPNDHCRSATQVKQLIDCSPTATGCQVTHADCQCP